MNISIRIEGLDQFTEALALLANAVGVNKDTSFTTPAPVTPAQEIADPAVPGRKKTPRPKTGSPEPITEPNITQEDIRALFIEKKRAGSSTETLRGMLKKHGVDRISALSAEALPAVKADLEVL